MGPAVSLPNGKYISRGELDEASHRLLKLVTERLGLSARSDSRILKVAWTITDLVRSEHIREQYLAEAIQYRSLDRSME